jgi:V/A-type H+/Na+-transporting ATPase subunit E
MAMEEVAKDILDKARGEADQRIRAAETERERILHEADVKIENMRKAEEKELQDNLARMRRQEISSAELEAKKIVLNARKDVLARTFEETLSELSKMKPQEKSALYKKILADGKKVIHKPKVFCPEGEADLLAGLRGCDSLTEIAIGPGLILENEDGSVRLDYRFKTILESIWNRELKTISNTLFE